ncbi:MAG: alpha/beta hydrolase-fold protein [Flavobacteriales bacterium]|nr:alpha/beta hydrolase-fold protein [Flavobacteriales bacterium]
MRKLLVALLFLPVVAHAQRSARTELQRMGPPQPYTIGVIETLRSHVLGEERVLNIHLPPGYGTDTTQRYPLIVLLDGSADEDFLHVVGGLQFASYPWINWMPPSILVGIANVDRKRDLTFPTTIAADKEKFPTTGGSAAFMAFLEREVLPFLQREYRIGNDRTLIGQSLGGLFATELLFRKPYLFGHYLIVSPSLWWDGGSLLQLNHDVLMAPDIGVATVHITVGDEGRGMVGPAEQLAALLRKESQARIELQRIHGLDHANILHRAVMDYFQWRGQERAK